MGMNGEVVGFSCASTRLSGLCHSPFIHPQPQTCKTLILRSCKGQLKALATILALPSENVIIRAAV